MRQWTRPPLVTIRT